MAGTRVIGLDPDLASLSKQKLSEIVRELMLRNTIEDHARVRLQVWRKPSKGRGYQTRTGEAHLLITIFPHEPFGYIIRNKVSWCERTHLTVSQTSGFKTLSSLPYVMAAMEQQEKGTDDLVLLDNRGFISECIMSNIFWVSDNTVYTPGLGNGCIEGIMRRQIMDQCKRLGIALYEVEEKPEVLQKANTVFSANVAGFYLFKTLEGQSYDTQHPVVNKLITSINQL